MLCLLGGVIGIVLGRGARSWLAAVYAALADGDVVCRRSWPSVGVSAAVGIVFGYYPAWKASRLDPIEALRYE